jgi:hypothetical protein
MIETILILTLRVVVFGIELRLSATVFVLENVQGNKIYKYLGK